MKELLDLQTGERGGASITVEGEINSANVHDLNDLRLSTREVSTLRSGRSRFPTKRSALVIALTVVIGSGVIYFVQFPAGRTSTPPKVERAVPVTVATAKTQAVPIQIHTIGNVLPYSIVNVIPQVTGQLTKVFFTQGQSVKKGDLLFQIDPRAYQAALDQAEGNVSRDKAQIQQAQAAVAKDIAQVGQLQANLYRDQAQQTYTQVEKTRYSTLLQQGAVSKEQDDQMNTNDLMSQATSKADKKAIENAEAMVDADKAAVNTAIGTMKADEAAADTARINLGFCRIHSPIDGRTGSLNVYEGNVVTANGAAPLVTIDQVQPIYVTLTVPEQYLDQVRKSLSQHTLKVEANIEGSGTNAVEGQVSFLENSVNTSTGTVVLRAAFANVSKRLFPGQFVDINVTMPPDGPTVVIPSSALQTSQQGTAVYVVNRDHKAAFTPVDVKRTLGDIAAIGKGLNAGDVVVTDGQLQLAPGTKVQITTDTTNVSHS